MAASLSAPILFEIADDLTQMEIIANVPGADVGALRVGQRVEFQVDAHPVTGVFPVMSSRSATLLA
jgi:HlyD family secretion protein